MEITYGSGCSGIESASLAWEPLGWKPQWFAEIEPFPSAVLAHRWPHVKNHGDMTLLANKVLTGEIEAPDVLVAGTPCQPFSVAGLQRGLDDPRGQLTISYIRLSDAVDYVRVRQNKPETIVTWENVPGVLSSKDNAFGCFLAGLSGSGGELTPGPRPEQGRSSKHWKWKKETNSHIPRWGNAGCIAGPKRTVAWRVIDAQYFGVAQRRRRVFLVASARTGFNPAKVLFESEGLRRDTPPSREKREEATHDIAGCLRASGVGTERIGEQSGQDPVVATQSHWDDFANPHPTLSQSHNTGGIGASNQEIFSQRGAGLVYDSYQDLTGTILANGKAAGSATQQDAESDLLVVHGTQDPGVNVDLAHTIGCNNGQESAVAFAENSRGELRLESGDGSLAGSLSTGGGKPGQGCPTIASYKQVRRLIPMECERLQGMPDNHTQIPWRNKAELDCPDGPRYKAIGNSKAIPCVEFIGRRIELEIINSSIEVAA